MEDDCIMNYACWCCGCYSCV